jgi:hypothetical protein
VGARFQHTFIYMFAERGLAAPPHFLRPLHTSHLTPHQDRSSPPSRVAHGAGLGRRRLEPRGFAAALARRARPLLHVAGAGGVSVESEGARGAHRRHDVEVLEDLQRVAPDVAAQLLV